jgi:hypothetical protein
MKNFERSLSRGFPLVPIGCAVPNRRVLLGCVLGIEPSLFEAARAVVGSVFVFAFTEPTQPF